MNTPLIKVPYPKAYQITERYQLSEDAQKILSNEHSPASFIDALEEESLYQDTVVFLAHALPPRECVAWGLACCREMGDQYNAQERVALAAAKIWCNHPDEINRRFAEQAAKKAELQTPPGWVAQAAFWSGGSITAQDAPAVPPPPWLYCHAIAGAVNLAAVLPDGVEIDKRYPLFLKKGLTIAKGLESRSHK